jgi:hypothetical protein
MLTRWKCYSGCTDFEITDLFEGDGERATQVAWRDAPSRQEAISSAGPGPGPGPCGGPSSPSPSPFLLDYVRAYRNGITGPLD